MTSRFLLLGAALGLVLVACTTESEDASSAASQDIIAHPQPPRCGGIAGLTCPSGMDCQLDGHYPDAMGTCKAAPAWDVCTRDADCIAVAAHECCSYGQKEAVNKDHVAEYDASWNPLLCTKVACALFIPPPDERSALCQAGRCAMVAVEDIACGGHTPNPHACPAGYACEGAGLPVDAPGSCAKK